MFLFQRVLKHLFNEPTAKSKVKTPVNQAVFLRVSFTGVLFNSNINKQNQASYAGTNRIRFMGIISAFRHPSMVDSFQLSISSSQKLCNNN